MKSCARSQRCGTLTAAAESLHLTQSALSHNIAKLERRAGVKLWEREGRSLRLTQAGHYLLATAERLLPQFESAETFLAQYAAGERGTLRIGMECHPCYQWLLKVVSRYLSDWPDVDVDVKQKFRFGGMGAQPSPRTARPYCAHRPCRCDADYVSGGARQA